MFSFFITGSPIRNLNIQCWSLFRDVDFHTRFHFDHYEFSGQWHGQYRGYKHGRVHEATSDHEHLIDVALALELSLAGSWISAVRFSLGTQAAESLGDREHRDTILKLFYILLVGIFYRFYGCQL